ncbi:transmembrane protein, putative [Medicago truncatula]|uniref:Transmembrane protein, putative n=1 Tax=Medicago truncatula TaxID=3880 RepID=A0A072TGP9_MEDTR|nr:transmembrane protein, putative [Medicago truncatula]
MKCNFSKRRSSSTLKIWIRHQEDIKLNCLTPPVTNSWSIKSHRRLLAALLVVVGVVVVVGDRGITIEKNFKINLRSHDEDVEE